MKKIEEMTVEELRARRAEIRTELEKPDADLDGGGSNLRENAGF